MTCALLPQKIGPHKAGPLGSVATLSKNLNVIISVATDFNRFGAALGRLQREQLPFAAALALTDTARAAQAEVTRALPAIFAAKGRPPTPFTMRAVGVTPARKSDLRAVVFVKRLQAIPWN